MRNFKKKSIKEEEKKNLDSASARSFLGSSDRPESVLDVMVLLLNPGLPGLRYLPANISAFAAATGPRQNL